MGLNIGIVDDNVFLTNNIKEKLSFFEDIEVGITAKDGSDLLAKLEHAYLPDIILMDIEMPVLNGIEATEIVKQKYPQIKIIILTTFDNDEVIFNAIKAGADGYLLKETEAGKLHDFLLHTMEGGAAMTPSIAMKTLKLLRNPAAAACFEDRESISLGKREIEVLEQVAAGLTYIQAGQNLFISPHTVRKHLENIYKKLQVHNKIEAVQKARKHNLI